MGVWFKTGDTKVCDLKGRHVWYGPELQDRAITDRVVKGRYG